MPFKKGEGGRPAGTKNKATAALKDMILQALSNVGGVKYLEKQARENPNIFCQLVGKVLPLQVSGPDGGPVQVKIIQNNYAAPPPTHPAGRASTH